MNARLPRWAKRLIDAYPGAEPPTPDNPMPRWLEEALRKAPLWHYIREVEEPPRRSPPYFLIEDARRQPELLRRTLGLAGRFEEIARRIAADGVEHVVFVGCGSAYYNSVLGAFVLPRLTGLSAEAVEAWEFFNYYEPRSRRTMVVAQSATGSSFEVLEAVRKARAAGMTTLALTNTEKSPLEELAHDTVCLPTGQRAGPDISVIPTRLVMMYLLALALGRLRRPEDPLVRRLQGQLDTVPELARRLFDEQERAIEALARKYYAQSTILLVGGGPNWFTALEMGLKIEEESSTPCRTYQTADYPHMAISLLRPERTTMVIAPPGPSYERLRACVRTARAAGSPAIAVVVEGDADISREADDVVVIPGPVDEMLVPPLGTIVGQVYGYYLGINRGWNPDCLGTDDLAHARAWLTSFPLGSH